MSRRRAQLLSAGLLFAALAALALAGSSSAATVSVDARGYQFQPDNTTVVVGDTIVWNNTDPEAHDVTFEAGFGSGGPGSILAGANWSYTFNTAGAIRYRCTLHSSSFTNGMHGVVIVVEPGTTVTMAAVPSSVLQGTALNLAGNASDSTGITAVFVKLDAGAEASAALARRVAGTNTLVDWSFALDTSTLSVGPHTLQVWASNGSANSTVALASFDVTGRPPAPAPVAGAGTWEVDLKDIAFHPQNLTVAVGDTVVWTNRDASPHDVNFQAGFGSGPVGSLAAGATFSHTFTAAGAYPYSCILHSDDFSTGMIGRVAVVDASTLPRLNISSTASGLVEPTAVANFSGRASDPVGVASVSVQLDSGAVSAATVAPVTAGDSRLADWSFLVDASTLTAGEHTLRVWATNSSGGNTTVYTVTFSVAAPPPAGGGAGPPSGNPFGETFIFEDIMSKYFWVIVGVTVIAIALALLFLSYSGKLQNYYIALLTAMDERMRFFAFARPTREFLYTIQRQMPRTHTERYNLKVIWYWYPLYCLGGISFAAFIIETITGIILGFYYIPEGTGPNEGLPSAAYKSMETIMTQVTFGYIFRALHHWGAHMMVAAVFLHMMRVYFVGAYKNPRELNWLLGVILFTITLGFGYTGYLLPWDQLAFWAGQIGLEMAYTIPVIGEIIGNMVFGGPELSGATIIRMYYLHVFVLPLVGGGLMVLHMGIVWMQGVAEPH